LCLFRLPSLRAWARGMLVSMPRILRTEFATVVEPVHYIRIRVECLTTRVHIRLIRGESKKDMRRHMSKMKVSAKAKAKANPQAATEANTDEADHMVILMLLGPIEGGLGCELIAEAVATKVVATGLRWLCTSC
jgi:hypothetical protein